MSSNTLELLIIAFIVIGMGVAIWKGGARNPVGTGGLDKRLRHMDSELKGLGSKVGELDHKVEDIDGRAASKNDIKRLERQLKDHSSRTEAMARDLATLRETSAARQASTEHVRRQVDALYDVIVKKGMGA
jgi:archaellum component FlaC